MTDILRFFELKISKYMSGLVLDISPGLAKKINQYLKNVEDKEKVFETFFEYFKTKIKREISEMQVDIEEFEKKHNMSSEDFYKRFENGELEDNNDFILWSGIIEMQKRSIEKLNQLA